ncbi:hypothetical protein EVAR_22270_1 [Eumeta japonica]|uniref:Uncharacterized protein n=1 Tax=Eumeta variegata TaxID=151549 RepID=A0A4C1UAK6_EUMVA|nr:hypothetical protein EVAR_22270_1 [Eumeta japonica]
MRTRSATTYAPLVSADAGPTAPCELRVVRYNLYRTVTYVYGCVRSSLLPRDLELPMTSKYTSERLFTPRDLRQPNALSPQQSYRRRRTLGTQSVSRTDIAPSQPRSRGTLE